MGIEVKHLIKNFDNNFYDFLLCKANKLLLMQNKSSLFGSLSFIIQF